MGSLQLIPSMCMNGEREHECEWEWGRCFCGNCKDTRIVCGIKIKSKKNTVNAY